MQLLEWDASTYDQLPLPHQRWGLQAIRRLRLTGDETVMELGCGTGRDAEQLLDALPNGRVVAVDGSEQMLAQLRHRLAGRLDRVTVVPADLRRTPPPPGLFDEPVDAVLSVATLHWLPDHDVIFRTVAAALRPGGRFVAEAGGAGSVERVRAALRAVSGRDDSSDGSGRLWNFAGIEQTTHRLRRAGFTDITVELVPDPAVLERGAQFEAYLATVILAAQLRELPAHQRHPFVRAVAQELGEPIIDYVRLQIDATRASLR
ncbi:MAG TPA: class I SAM-dependent methyltransferase [Pseudonocardiaceae bacterium]|nr:class I SAM-dependent methyltransferase [Pseudonocardiaceae bacterium]